MVKIVFINAYEISYLGTRVLAAWARKLGHDTHNILLAKGNYHNINEPLEQHEGYQAYANGILSVNAATEYKISNEDWEALAEVIKIEKPDIIGFSARSTNNWLAPAIISVLKIASPTSLFIAGGFGPTLEPEVYLNAGFHCVLRGDGEEPLKLLLEFVDEDKDKSFLDRDDDRFLSIPGSVWKYGTGIKKNKLDNQQKDLSRYAAPLHGHENFSYIDNGKLQYRHDPQVLSNTYYTYIGRGCTGHCTYCSGGQWRSLYLDEGKKAYKRRNRDLAELRAELLKIPDNSHHIWFVDEFFSLSTEKTVELCNMLKNDVRRTFFCYLNYDFVLEKEWILHKLIDAGLVGTGVGFQTGSESFSRDVYDRNIKNEKLLRFARLCAENNLYLGLQFIGGNCYETDEVFNETINLIRQLPFSIETPSRAHLQNIRLRPHPGSPIRTMYPRVVTNPMSAKEWFYRAILMEFARIVCPEEFDELRKDKKWQDDPATFNNFYRERLNTLQQEHYRKLLQSLAGKPVVFYGHGKCYEANKEFFRELKPLSIVVDKRFIREEKVDGMKVHTPEDFLQIPESRSSELVWFIMNGSGTAQHIKLNHKYGIPNSQIHNLHIALKS